MHRTRLLPQLTLVQTDKTLLATISLTHTLSLCIGEGKGGEGGEGKESVPLPVLNGDSKWQTEERDTVRQGELTVVVQRVPGKGRGGGGGGVCGG